MNCCNKPHAWDLHSVPSRWKPPEVRCLIIGENPGGAESIYFYDPPSRRDPVRVRGNLLHGLASAGLIREPTLTAFRAAGFLFDHGVRCHMPFEEVEALARTADRPMPPLPGAAQHLRTPIAEAMVVWVMGRIARKAVGSIAGDFPTQRDQISKAPYPCRLAGTKYFVSRYLSRISRMRATTICYALRDSFPEILKT